MCLFKKKFVAPADMDEQCIELCTVLNSLPGVRTTESCCGHLRHPYRIFFDCRNFTSLAILARVFDRRYLPSKIQWRLVADSGDMYPKYGFMIESIDTYKSDNDVLYDVRRIIDNINYWRMREYKAYFFTNNLKRRLAGKW